MTEKIWGSMMFGASMAMITSIVVFAIWAIKEGIEGYLHNKHGQYSNALGDRWALMRKEIYRTEFMKRWKSFRGWHFWWSNPYFMPIKKLIKKAGMDKTRQHEYLVFAYKYGMEEEGK